MEVSTTESNKPAESRIYYTVQPLNTLIGRLSLTLFSEQTMLAQKANGTVFGSRNSKQHGESFDSVGWLVCGCFQK